MPDALSNLITYERSDNAIGRITLRRVDALNAINGPMMRALGRRLDAFDDDPDARIAIVAGEGRAFCAGGDVHDVRSDGPVDPAEDRTRLGEMFLRRGRYKPLIAAVHGHAVGMGVHMALLCDFIVCAESAKFTTPEVHFGLNGATYWWHLQSRAGDAFATEVVATGRPWSGREAAQRGLVTCCVPEEMLLVEAERLAQTLAAQPAGAVRALIETRRAALRRIELEAWHSRAKDRDLGTSTPNQSSNSTGMQ